MKKILNEFTDLLAALLVLHACGNKKPAPTMADDAVLVNCKAGIR